MTLVFAECRLDLDARRVFRDSREIHLSPKGYELLKLLVENRPRALSKEEILAQVWPGVFVSDASLTKIVNEVREAVGDRARQSRIIRTVHGYGYGFVADAFAEESAQTGTASARRVACRLVCGQREFALADGEHLAGRDADSSVWLDSPKVSRQHARIMVSASEVTIEDLASKNGTFVGSVRITQRTVLVPGDRIGIGDYTLVFHRAREPRSTETAGVTPMRRRTARQPG